jgi:hypothetical protein
MEKMTRPVKRFVSLIAVACVFPAAFGQTVPLNIVVECEDFSARQGGTFNVPPLKHEDHCSVRLVGNGDWLRFDSVNFCGGTFDSASFHSAGYNGYKGGIHLRLGSPTGTDLAVWTEINGWGYSPIVKKPLSTKLTGYQTLYMTFEGADTLCTLVDWCRISGTATYNPSEAATYYVAPYGDDGNDGLSVTTAFKTIQRAATVMKPGSTCNIRQGVYRETVTPRYTGLPSAPMIFQAYGNEQPFINGADSITGWVQHSGSIYKTRMNWTMGEYKDQLLIDGNTCVVARTPNIDDPWPRPREWGVENGFMDLVDWSHWQRSGEIHPYLCPARVYFWDATTAKADPVTGVWDPNTIFIAELHDNLDVQPDYLFGKPPDFFKGGLYINQNGWWQRAMVIKSSRCFKNSEGTEYTAISYGKAYNNENINSSFGENLHGPGYLSYSLNFLDAPNEWYRDSSGTVYLWAPDGGNPSSHLVEAKRRVSGFNLPNKSYITLKGLRFLCTSASLDEAWYCTIDDCHWKYPSYFDTYQWFEEFCGPWMNSPYDPSNGFSGVYIGGGYNTVKNSSSVVSASAGFLFSGWGHHVATNNIIHDCNWLPTYSAGIRQYKRNQSNLEECGGCLYEYNTIYNCGRGDIEIDFGAGGSPPLSERTRIMHNNLGRSAFLAAEASTIWTVNVRDVEMGYNIFHSVCNNDFISADAGTGWKIHHNVFYRGKPINPQTTTRYNWGAPLVNIVPFVGDPTATCFHNSFVDSANQSNITDVEWMPRYDPWIHLNNLYGWSDTVKWKYTDPVNHDYSLREGSPAIDAGVVIPDFLKQFPRHAGDDKYQSEDDNYVGKAPDLGAYEFGKPAWKAGANWQEKPWVYPPTQVSIAALPGGLHGAYIPSLRIMPRALVINGMSAAPYSVRIYNMQGAVVLTRVMAKGGTAVIPTDRMTAGMYVLRANIGSSHVARWKVCIRQ